MSKVLPSDDVVKSTPEGSHTSQTSPATSDIEKQQTGSEDERVNASKTSVFKSLGWLDRFLALWIFLAMAIGIILGNFVPNTGPALQKGKFVGVSIPIGILPHTIVTSVFTEVVLAIGLLVMMYPILCKVKFETLHHVFGKRDVWIQILFSVIVNWLIAPLVMVCVILSHRLTFLTTVAVGLSLGLPSR